VLLVWEDHIRREGEKSHIINVAFLHLEKSFLLILTKLKIKPKCDSAQRIKSSWEGRFFRIYKGVRNISTSELFLNFPDTTDEQFGGLK